MTPTILGIPTPTILLAAFALALGFLVYAKVRDARGRQ